MARITYVKAAQQRYEQVPVIDPETGEQKRTPVTGKDGQQKVTKRGAPVFLSVTVADKSKPLPPRKCDSCHQEIQVGSPYKHISPRSGPYGGHTLYRCDICPNWHVWEYSSSLSARLSEIEYDFSNAIDEVESEDDVQSALDEAAERVREIAQEKGESADNIEEGFQHETYQSQELREQSESLESWADEISSATIPDFPEPEEADCEECNGEGDIENDELNVILKSIKENQEALDFNQKKLALLKAKVYDPLDLPLINKLPIAINLCVINGTRLQAKLEETEARVPCEACDGSGRIEPDEPTADQIDEWRDEVRNDLSIVGESPV